MNAQNISIITCVPLRLFAEYTLLRNAPYLGWVARPEEPELGRAKISFLCKWWTDCVKINRVTAVSWPDFFRCFGRLCLAVAYAFLMTPLARLHNSHSSCHRSRPLPQTGTGRRTWSCGNGSCDTSHASGSGFFKLLMGNVLYFVVWIIILYAVIGKQCVEIYNIQNVTWQVEFWILRLNLNVKQTRSGNFKRN